MEEMPQVGVPHQHGFLQGYRYQTKPWISIGANRCTARLLGVFHQHFFPKPLKWWLKSAKLSDDYALEE